MVKKYIIKSHETKLTLKEDINPEIVRVDDSVRLREIRKLVEANNKSTLSTDLIICQIYMESRFEKNAHSDGSSAIGLMQLLKAPIRELARLNNLKKPRHERQPELELYKEADKFHDSPELRDEATNIRLGTEYIQALIDKNTSKGSTDPIADAYKDYRGLRNGIYYRKISHAASELAKQPNSMSVLRDMVK